MAMFLVVGCQTTQSAETETVPEVVEEVQVLPKEKELPKEKATDNPFANKEIPAGIVVTSNKPVICGRIDIMLVRMEERFGEVPVFMGKIGVQNPGEDEKQVVATMTYNKQTGSFTFLEQMPLEERLMCILSTGHGKFAGVNSDTSL